MKKVLVGMLLMVSVLLVACGGLKGQLDGNSYTMLLKYEGNSKEMGTVKFDGDKATIENSGEKISGTYEVKDQDISLNMKEKDDKMTVNIKDVKEDKKNKDSLEGKPEMIQNGKDFPLPKGTKIILEKK